MQEINHFLTLTGINLREKQGKQTGERIFRTANRPTAARYSNLEPGKESTPERRRMATRKVTPFDVKQVDNSIMLINCYLSRRFNVLVR